MGQQQNGVFNKRMQPGQQGQGQPSMMTGGQQMQQMRNGMPGGRPQVGPAGGRGPMQQQQQGGPGRGNYLMQPGAGMMQQQPGRGGGGGVKFNSSARNQNGLMPQQGNSQPMNNASMSVPGLGEPLDDQALAQADPQMQKNMIGEKLYPLIYVHQASLAGKITGMLLEMDNAELLNLIESPDALLNKIEEAMLVLKNHSSNEE